MADRGPEPGKGVLFNVREKRSDKSPDMTGHVWAHRDIKKGERIALSAWNRTAQSSGQSFLSLAASDPFIPKAKEKDGDGIPF